MSTFASLLRKVIVEQCVCFAAYFEFYTRARYRLFTLLLLAKDTYLGRCWNAEASRTTSLPQLEKLRFLRLSEEGKIWLDRHNIISTITQLSRFLPPVALQWTVNFSQSCGWFCHSRGFMNDFGAAKFRLLYNTAMHLTIITLSFHQGLSEKCIRIKRCQCQNVEWLPHVAM